MNPLLAMVIEDSVVTWIIAGLSVAIPSTCTGIWILWRQLINFLKPLILKAFGELSTNLDEHRELVIVMKGSIPTIIKTQDNQTKLIEKLGEKHQEHSTKLDSIMVHLKVTP
jgi:uncharacterized membrane protein YfbV (UPF0208 family)